MKSGGLGGGKDKGCPRVGSGRIGGVINKHPQAQSLPLVLKDRIHAELAKELAKNECLLGNLCREIYKW